MMKKCKNCGHKVTEEEFVNADNTGSLQYDSDKDYDKHGLCECLIEDEELDCYVCICDFEED